MGDRGGGRFKVAWAMLVAFVASALPIAGVSVILHGIEQDGRRRAVESLEGQLSQRLKEQVAVRLELVASLAREMELGGLAHGPQFKTRAEQLQERFPGYQAINFIASDGRIAQVVPEAANRPALGRNVKDHPVAAGPYAEAIASGTPRITPPLQLFQGGAGFASYFPVDGGALGTVNGVFRIAPVVEMIVDAGTLERHSVEVRVDGEPVFQRGAPLQRAAPDPLARSFSLFDQRWSLHLAPLTATVGGQRPSTALVVAGLGVLLGLLVAALVGVSLRRRMRSARELEAAERARRLEALGTLAGGIAHDFNNLLAVFGSTLEMVQRVLPPDAPQRRDLAVVMDATERASTLTEQLLAFSRHRPTTMSPFEVSAAVAGARELLTRLLPEAVVLRVQDEAAGLWLRGDVGAFQQMLINLATNARDAMDGQGVLAIHVGPASSPHAPRLALTVEDEGCGMDADTLERAFDPFFTTKEAGTGLGMAMVARTVERFRGTVRAESRLGQGTQVHITLPLAAAPEGLVRGRGRPEPA